MWTLPLILRKVVKFIKAVLSLGFLHHLGQALECNPMWLKIYRLAGTSIARTAQAYLQKPSRSTLPFLGWVMMTNDDRSARADFRRSLSEFP